MRSLIVGAVAAAGLGLAFCAASAAPMDGMRSASPQQTLVEHAQSSRYCARLRRACEFKHERGEAGEGNCQRFRRECGYGYRGRRW
jgi:hypothetical protein